MAGPLAMVCMVMVYDSIMNMTRRLTRKITIKLSKFGKQVTWLNGPRVLTLLWAPGCSVHRGCLSHGGGEGEMLWVPPSRTFLGTKNGGGNTSPTPRGATSTGRGGCRAGTMRVATGLSGAELGCRRQRLRSSSWCNVSLN